MSKTIQIRNVPDDVHRTLMVRAAQAGLSLSGYLRRELERIAARPSIEDVLARIRGSGGPAPGKDSATAVRAERNARYG